jgi:pectate lyase
MPDAWETAHGLDPKDPADATKVVPAGASKDDRHRGYTYIEFYVNELADGLVR